MTDVQPAEGGGELIVVKALDVVVRDVEPDEVGDVLEDSIK